VNDFIRLVPTTKRNGQAIYEQYGKATRREALERMSHST